MQLDKELFSSGQLLHSVSINNLMPCIIDVGVLINDYMQPTSERMIVNVGHVCSTLCIHHEHKTSALLTDTATLYCCEDICSAHHNKKATPLDPWWCSHEASLKSLGLSLSLLIGIGGQTESTLAVFAVMQ